MRNRLPSIVKILSSVVSSEPFKPVLYPALCTVVVLVLLTILL